MLVLSWFLVKISAIISSLFKWDLRRLMWKFSLLNLNSKFKALPVIIFFSAMINLFYYLGILQYFILKLSWVINKLMGTSPTESINTVANIFIGQVTLCLLFLRNIVYSKYFTYFRLRRLFLSRFCLILFNLKFSCI